MLLQRFGSLFSTHVDAMVAVSEHFVGDFVAATSSTAAVWSQMWQLWEVVTPQMQRPALMDLTYREIYRAGISYRAPSAMPASAPIDGEWSPLRPSDQFAASVILSAAQAYAPTLDWPLLFLLVRTKFTADDWALATQRTLDRVLGDIRALQLSAEAVIVSVMLDIYGPSCAARPALTVHHGVQLALKHLEECPVCGPYRSLLVQPARLVSATAATTLTPSDRQALFRLSLEPPKHRPLNSRWFRS